MEGVQLRFEGEICRLDLAEICVAQAQFMLPSPGRRLPAVVALELAVAVVLEPVSPLLVSMA